MRSSDPTEDPVFPGLKRIIIIISLPGSGRELHYEHKRRELPASALKGTAKAEGARFKEMSSPLTISQLHTFFAWFCT